VISGQEVGIMLIDSRSSSAAFYPNEVSRILQRHQMKATTNVSKAKSRCGFTLVEMLVVIGMIGALAGISFPVYKSIQKKVDKQKMVMVFNSFDMAIDNFQTEYSYVPYFTAAYPTTDVYYNTEADFSSFVKELTGLTGNSNFKKIAFLDGPEASGNGGSYNNGLGLDRDAIYSPYNTKFYRIKLDYDGDGVLKVPLTADIDQTIGFWVIYDWDDGDGVPNPVGDNFIAFKGTVTWPGWME
jgi:prepilin-type N-terminal cleavage/methylation domain-containing protein